MVDTRAIARALMGDLQQDYDLSAAQAAGVVGNLMHESGGFGSLQEINPLVPGSEGGYGYAQWTGPRRDAFEEFVASNGLDPTSYEANYGFLQHELANNPYEHDQFMTVRNAETAEEAARLISQNYLRPGIPHMPARINYANQALGYAAPTPATRGIMANTLPQVGPTGGPSLNGAQPPRGGGLMAAWNNVTSGIGNLANMGGERARGIMGSAPPFDMRSLIGPAMRTVAGRTAVIDPMVKNIFNGPPRQNIGSGGYRPNTGTFGLNLDTIHNGFSGSGSSGGAHGGSDNDKHRGETYQPKGRRN